MSFKTHLNNKYWNDSKQIFFTPKLSLEGRNMFPQLTEANTLHPLREPPFLNILKKPIMSLYDRTPIRSEKKPVCIVGLSKEVQIRNIKTGQSQKHKQDLSESNLKKQTLSTFVPITKTQIQMISSTSKQLAPLTFPSQGHCYVLGSGNNRQIVEQVLQKRQGWYPTASSIFHLRWEQARPKFQNVSAPHRQVINHLPGHEVITDKGNLLANLKSFCEKNEQLMYKIVPASFILDFAAEDLEEELKKFVTFFVQCNWKSEPNPEKDDSEDMKNSKLTSRKKGVGDLVAIIDSPKKNSNKAIKISPAKPNKLRIEIPFSIQIKKKQEVKNQYKTLITSLRGYRVFQDMSAPKKDSLWATPEADQVYGDSSLWLLKPSDLNRGRGIKLFRTIQQLSDLLRSELSKHDKGSFVVQKYIERPLLIQGRKFDIRVWALVTHTRELYFFKEGYIRLTSQQYNLESSSLLTHLTNNAVQKYGTNYGQFQEGNILPLSKLYEEGLFDKDVLLGDIKSRIVSSMKAAGSKLYQPSEKHQSISVGRAGGKQSSSKIKYFQIFGYDFMVDKNHQIWLIEVNTNPCLELSNKWLTTIIPRMLDDCFRLTVDKIFGRKGSNISQYHVQNYANDSNMWELLELTPEACSPLL